MSDQFIEDLKRDHADALADLVVIAKDMGLSEDEVARAWNEFSMDRHNATWISHDTMCLSKTVAGLMLGHSLACRYKP